MAFPLQFKVNGATLKQAPNHIMKFANECLRIGTRAFKGLVVMTGWGTSKWKGYSLPYSRCFALKAISTPSPL